jgi:hypothetical protein
MKVPADIKVVRRSQAQQGGVFPSDDLASLYSERHPVTLARRAQAMASASVLCRFIQSYYVVPDAFDLDIVSQPIAPNSYISLGSVLAQELVVGSMPEHETHAVKKGRRRVYEGAGRRLRRRCSTPYTFICEVHAIPSIFIRTYASISST